MHIKIIDPKKNSNTVYDNSGSCTRLVNYLFKEDKERGAEKEFFFNHTKDQVSSAQVINTIDHLRGGIGKKDVKFYSLVISPKDAELTKINNSTFELREYTRKVMEEYAACFNGKNQQKNVQAKDLAYFGKIEFNRYYKGNDEEVKQKKVKQGDKKQGNNMHVHIIVARKDITDKIKLSPQVKDKKLFHIEGFKLRGCYLFDKEYLTNDAALELEVKMIERTGNTNEINLYKRFKPIHSTSPISNKNETSAAILMNSRPDFTEECESKKGAPLQNQDTLGQSEISNQNTAITEKAIEKLKEQKDEIRKKEQKKNDNNLGSGSSFSL